MPVRLIDANALEPDTEWDDRYDGFLSYSQAQIDAAPTIEPEVLMIKNDSVRNLTDEEAAVFDEWLNHDAAIEAEPVRHGRWIDNGNDKFICSACKGYVYSWFGKSDFCPRCGADQRGRA